MSSPPDAEEARATTRQYRRHATVVCHELEGDAGALLVPVDEGFATLEAATRIDPATFSVWRGLGDSFGLETVVAALRSQGADPATAARDAAALVEALVGRGLVSSATPTETPAPGRGPSSDPAALDAAAVLNLARQVLRAGHALRFVARGLSMRPQIPDHSWIEVEPRAIDEVRVGEIALFTTSGRLVAHRVVERRAGGPETRLVTRGDSASRRDLVRPQDLLGIVVARLERGPNGSESRHDLLAKSQRRRGRFAAWLHGVGDACKRAFFIAPLKRSKLLRRVFGGTLAFGSNLLRKIENRSFRGRRSLDVARSALMSTAEKEAERQRLYADKQVRDFTALDENVEAGLTLLEEVLLARHPIPPGRALILGCGPGRECVAFAQRGFDVTGLDLDRDMLEHARALAERHGVAYELVQGPADTFELDAEFDVVVIFSGLYNMLLPSARRVEMLASSRRHLVPGGRVLVTFLSDYVRPGSPAPLDLPTVWSRVNPEHENGDLYLLNETIHVFPHENRLRAEARAAGLDVEVLQRDQRAYERSRGQVRGYAILRRPTASATIGPSYGAEQNPPDS